MQGIQGLSRKTVIRREGYEDGESGWEKQNNMVINTTNYLL